MNTTARTLMPLLSVAVAGCTSDASTSHAPEKAPLAFDVGPAQPPDTNSEPSSSDSNRTGSDRLRPAHHVALPAPTNAEKKRALAAAAAERSAEEKSNVLGFLQRADLQVWSDVEEQPPEVDDNGVSHLKKSFSLTTEGAEFTALFFGSADLQQSTVTISAGDEFVREYHASDVVDGILATDMFPGDTVDVTLKWRPDTEEPILELDQVVHGAPTDLGSGGAEGGAGCEDAPKVCKQNVRCVPDPEVLAIATGIVFITINRTVFEGASGTFLNNDREDCDPLILSAEHVVPDQISPGSARYYYNHEVNCDGSFIPLKQGTTGSTLLASWDGPVCGSNAVGTDFSLLRLRSVPASWNDVSMNGWDAGLFPPNGDVATIHHPNNEYKEIAVSNDDDLTTCSSGPGYAHVVPDWEYGGTRNGSSGAPLFASDGQVIGQLNGGGDCGCDGDCVCNDKFGSLTQSFIGEPGAPDSAKLEPWLTPSAPGINALETKRLNCWPEIIGFGRVSSSSHGGDGTTTYTFSAPEAPSSVALMTDQEVEADEVFASGDEEYTAVFSSVPTTGPRTGILLVEGRDTPRCSQVRAPIHGKSPATRTPRYSPPARPTKHPTSASSLPLSTGWRTTCRSRFAPGPRRSTLD